MEVSDLIKGELSFLIKTRRDLHKMPELSGEEYKTSEYIFSLLSEFSYKPKKIHTGVYADIKGENDKYTIALRADIDALPITEKADVDYKSDNGLMHACGHDAHTAMLLTIAKILKTKKPKCNVRLVFQFGEEGAGGAMQMIDAGVLKNADEIYALHVSPLIDKGEIETCGGAMFAGAVEFKVKFAGCAAHCADREKGLDAIKALTYFLSKIDTANEKCKNNTLLHIGKIRGGVARNVVADYADALCTLRYFDSFQQEEVMMNISRILTESDNLFKTSHTLEVECLYEPLINSEKAVSTLKKLNPDIKECAPKFTAEDFGAYTQKISGAMAWLGIKDEKNINVLHSDKFSLDESALLYGVEMFYRLIY